MKWHYFDPSDTICVGKLDHPFKSKSIPYRKTYCGQNLQARPHLKHTEFKSRVDCLVCLSMINMVEYDRSGGRYGS